MTTVALYARVSSRKQEQNNTIESQVVELERRIATDGHKLLNENKFKDNGFSGWNLKREGLDELRDKVGEGEVDKIYIHSPDRLSRKSSHQMILLEEFEKEGAEVIFLNYKTENNPESKLLLGVQGLISEYECAKIMERSRRGKLHAARKGCVSVMGNAPYGYRYIKHVVREEAKFEIDEEEAKVVRKLFEWVGQERVSLKETTRRLKEMCITAPKGRRNWHSGTVCRMLRNPAYKGQAAFGKTNVGPIKKEMKAIWKVRKKSYSIYQTEKKNWIHIEIPNIVEEELFDIVQKQLLENKKRARMQQSGRKYLLQGLMVCQCCKYTYYGMSNVKGGRSYYRCPGTDANRFGGNRVCSSKSIRADILEEVVWEEVKMVLKEPEAMTKVRLLKYENKQAKDELEKRADKIEQGIERLAYVYARGHLTKEKYDVEVEAMEKELKGIRDQKEEVSDEKRLKKELDFITSSVESFSSEIESELNQADHGTKLDIIRKLVQRIEIDDDNVHIVFRLKELALERQKKSVQHCIGIPVSSTGMTEKQVSSHHLLSSQCVTLGSSPLKNIVLSNAIGMHKVSNALAAISVAIKLGISNAEIKKGLLEFQGVARRFSLVANIKGVKLIEDYAHHPNEIYATLTAARSITKGKVIGIIEPLRFARIRNFFDEFIRIFMIFDYVILTPVHPPEDKPIPGCGIDDIQEALISNGFNNVKIMNDSLLISHFISDSTNSGDVVLFIGAGSNIAKLAKETAELITETIQTSS